MWACAPILSLVIEPMARTLPPVAALLTLTAVFVLFTQNPSLLRIRL